MKIEKLTENKIRVILNSNELNIDDDNLHTVMYSSELFLDILNKAEKEVNFCTDGCKLLIEAFSSLDDFFVFTITKYVQDTNKKVSVKPIPVVKRKSFDKLSKHVIFKFEDFDSFCDFCKRIENLHKLKCGNLIKNSSLYLWKDCYYLILKNVNIKSENSYLLYSILSEFAKVTSFSNSFESKLLEYGELIIKKDAINIGINFFTK